MDTTSDTTLILGLATSNCTSATTLPGLQDNDRVSNLQSLKFWFLNSIYTRRRRPFVIMLGYRAADSNSNPRTTLARIYNLQNQSSHRMTFCGLSFTKDTQKAVKTYKISLSTRKLNTHGFNKLFLLNLFIHMFI